MATHRWPHVMLIVLAAALQIATIAVQMTALSMYDISKEWFNEKGRGGGDSRRHPLGGGRSVTQPSYYNLYLGPPGWFIDMIWPLTYIFQLAWLAYGLSTIARTTPDGRSYLYTKPYYMPVAMYVSYIVSMILRLAWSGILYRCGPVCAGLVVGSFVSSAVAVIISMMALFRSGPALYRQGLSLEVWLVRGLVHNGLAWFAAVEFMASVIHLMGVMVHDGYSQRNATVTMLAIGMLFLLGFGLVDLIFFEKYMRYTLSPYVVMSLGLIGMISAHWYSGSPSVIALLALMLTLIILIMKIVNIAGRRRKDREPIDRNKIRSKDRQAPPNRMMMPLRIATRPQVLYPSQIPRNNNFNVTYI